MDASTAHDNGVADTHFQAGAAAAETARIAAEHGAAQAKIAHPPVDLPATPPLPEGWCPGVCQNTGKQYFYCIGTGESRWDAPPLVTFTATVAAPKTTDDDTSAVEAKQATKEQEFKKACDPDDTKKARAQTAAELSKANRDAKMEEKRANATAQLDQAATAGANLQQAAAAILLDSDDEQDEFADAREDLKGSDDPMNAPAEPRDAGPVFREVSPHTEPSVVGPTP